MLWKYAIIVIALITRCISSPFKTLLPQKNLYIYRLVTNVTTGTLTSKTYWALEGTLCVQTYDDFGTARFTFDGIKSVHGRHGESHQINEDVKYLKNPWEVGSCFTAIRSGSEPVWVSNIKRAISYNFLYDAQKTSPTSNEEPCLYGNCVVVYTRLDNKTRKYISLVDERRSQISSYEHKCLPNRSSDWFRPSYADSSKFVMTAERAFELDNEEGLKSLQLKSDFQYRMQDQILTVTTELTLQYIGVEPAKKIEKLNLTESTMQYVPHNYSNPSNGIWETSQDELRNKTYDILLVIAKKGIDADNIVRNASFIHNLDFIELLNIMSQLNYMSLKKLYIDVLGTSYELETARNICLELLPYVRSDSAAKLIKHLVVEQKQKIEDSMLLSLIRKLPFNLIEYSRPLLEELEVLSKLGPDFPQEIRHAGILSFASLVYKTMEVAFDQQYFDDIYEKYLRMYNNCPQYLDRLIWLQGMTNIGKSVVNYLDEIHTDPKKDHHERLWAALASLNIWKGSTLENTIPILMNGTEHITLRIIALHAFLSTPLGARDFMNVHNYVMGCKNVQLKKFWYSTVKSLESNRFYHRYKSASYFIPLVASQVKNRWPKQWATNNYIISQEPSLDVHGPTFQILTTGNGAPELIVIEFSTGGATAYNAAIYIIAEGVTSNVFKRLQNYDAYFKSFSFSGELLEELKLMKVQLLEQEKIHIDIVIKVYDKTVYATHIDQEKFDSWNLIEVKKTIEDFVRFGSHINQQMVYYPIQMAKDFPSEIGTPIRLQSTVVSFTSLRGNLTAPSTEEDLTWRNDLHIRYQGTSLTSLSTAGPLQPTEHIARIQQSIVVHLPIKFDVKISPANRSLELKWTNPAQNGGLAMHSRTQISTRTQHGPEVHTVTLKNKKKKDDGIFFDCDHSFSEAQMYQLLTSGNYNLLSSLQPSHLILSSLQLLTSPTSCGIILPPNQLQQGNIFKVEFRVDEFKWDENDGHMERFWRPMKIGLAFESSYYREENEKTTYYLSVKGSTTVESDGRDGTFDAELSVQQPIYGSSDSRDWTICISEHHKLATKQFNVDFTATPVPYDGVITISTGSNISCNSNGTGRKIVVNFKSVPSNKSGKRRLDVNITGENSEWVDIFENFKWQTTDLRHYYTTDLKDDRVIVSVNGTNELGLKSELFSWMPVSHTTVQALQKAGFYHVCRIQRWKVQTFSGEVLDLSNMRYKFLAAGDCTNTPRFAVMPTYFDRGLSVYSGDELLTLDWRTSQTPYLSVTGPDEPSQEFRIASNGDTERLIRSKFTGVLVYHHLQNETVILVPQGYMGTVCGACTGQFYYKD